MCIFLFSGLMLLMNLVMKVLVKYVRYVEYLHKVIHLCSLKKFIYMYLLGAHLYVQLNMEKQINLSKW